MLYESVETEIVKVLTEHGKLSIKDVVYQIRKENPEISANKIELIGMNMVERGKLELTMLWKLRIPNG